MLDVVKNILKVESQAINKISEKIDESFILICEELSKTTGKLIVSGMGKSGHVGRKMAASLSSTGTSSFFVHPAEAYHGDLGMFQKGDSVILISNSGESSEVVNLIKPLKDRGIEYFAMTGNKDSTLGKHSRGVIDIFVDTEGCPLGLAPFASTTVTMAMGDAISGVLMKMKNFKSEDFALYHPGGSLGRGLLNKIEDVMTSKKTTIHKGSSFNEIAISLTSNATGCVLVSDDENNLLGIITDGDFRRTLTMNSNTQRWDLKTEDFVSKGVITTTIGTKLSEVENVMKINKIHNIVVLDENNKIKGLYNI